MSLLFITFLNILIIKPPRRRNLSVITIINLIYGCLTAGLVLYSFNSLTLIGVGYFVSLAKKNHPENVPVLLNNIIRDVITPGSKTDTKPIMKNRFPIFSYKENIFKFRYMRYWIISGHKRCKQVVKKELVVALNQIDAYFNKKENSLQFRMEPGDILLINNNFICHNRSEYENHEDPIKSRTLIRTWINNPTNLR